jgi:hypothetical protein
VSNPTDFSLRHTRTHGQQDKRPGKPEYDVFAHGIRKPASQLTSPLPSVHPGTVRTPCAALFRKPTRKPNVELADIEKLTYMLEQKPRKALEWKEVAMK